MTKFIEFDQASTYDPNKTTISINVDRIISFAPSNFFDPTFGKRECTLIHTDGKMTAHVLADYETVKRMIVS